MQVHWPEGRATSTCHNFITLICFLSETPAYAFMQPAIPDLGRLEFGINILNKICRRSSQLCLHHQLP